MPTSRKVEVSWDDASLYSERHPTVWLQEQARLIPMKTVGYMIKHSHKIVIVAGELNTLTGEVCSATVIPRSCVTSIRRLE